MERRSLRSAVEASPQAPARIDPEFEVTIERVFNSVGSRDERRLFAPDAVLYAAQVHDRVPAVRALPQLTIVQVAEVQADGRIRAGDQRGTYGYDRRQHFWRPEDRLLKIGLTGISCEKPTPIAVETRYSR